MARGLLLTALLLLCAVPASRGHAQEIYRYTDESGQTHFTDSYATVPERYRDQVRRADLELDLGGRVAIVPGLNGEPPAEAAGTAAASKEAPALGVSGLWDNGLALWGGLGIVLGLVFGLLVVVPLMLAIGSLILKLACRLGGQPDVSFAKGMGVALLMFLLNSAVLLPLQIVVGPDERGGGLLWVLVSVVLALVTYTAVLRGMHCDTVGGAAKVAVLYMVLPGVLALGLILIALVLGFALR